jgi:hypothetical protein
MTTHTTFDLAALSRAIEERDAQPEIRTWIEDVCSRDMTHRIASLVASDNQVALTEECQYPDGTNVLCSCMAELRGGLISKQSVVQVWDDPL